MFTKKGNKIRSLVFGLVLIYVHVVGGLYGSIKIDFLSSGYHVKQGQTVRAQIKVDTLLTGTQSHAGTQSLKGTPPSVSARIKFLSKVYKLFPVPKKVGIYECYLPIECEGLTGRFPMIARVRTRNNEIAYARTEVDIEKKIFPKQRGYKRRRGDTGRLECKPSRWLWSLSEKSPKRHLWEGRFLMPTKVVRYSSPFGEIRSSRARGRYLHRGVDIVAPWHHPVKASQNGNVVVKKRCKYSGNFVVIDHGLGILTYYLHLDGFGKIRVGDFVKKGTVIGTVGNTGHSFGDHLHWGLSINNVLVDPCEWTTKKFD